MTKMEKYILIRMFAVVVLSIAGLLLIGIENWKIALGVFLFVWSNNLENSK